MRYKSTLTACLLVLLSSTNRKTFAQATKPVLASSTAKAIAQACEARAHSEGWKMNIAIVDDGGNLNYFTRMDGAFLMSGKIALLKANTSSGLPLSTRKFDEISKAVAGMGRLPETTTIPGGLPILTPSGVLIGAIGVSGGSPEQDEQCAQAGIDVAKAILK